MNQDGLCRKIHSLICCKKLRLYLQKLENLTDYDYAAITIQTNKTKGLANIQLNSNLAAIKIVLMWEIINKYEGLNIGKFVL